MFKEVFLFELRYRLSRKVTFVYFAVVWLLSFLVITGPDLNLRNALGQTSANAPYIISLVTLVLSFVFTMIISAVMGVPVIRDLDHQLESILYSTPLTRSDYLLGRFAGSFVVCLWILFGIPLGLAAGYALAHAMPWEVALTNRNLLPFNAWHFIHPYLLFTVINAFVFGSFFFMAGALGRKPLYIYLQGAGIIMLYQLSINVAGEIGSYFWAAVIDPFGIHTFVYLAKYWTAVEQNELLMPLSPALIVNRVGWLIMGATSLWFTIKFYRMEPHQNRSSTAQNKSDTAAEATLVYPVITRIENWGLKFARLTSDHFKMMWKEIPFLVIIGSGTLILIINFMRMDLTYMGTLIPSTSTVLTALSSFDLFLTIIVVFYSGEMIWKERGVRFNAIADALPVTTLLDIFSKLFAIILTCLVLLVGLALIGIFVQSMITYSEIHYEGYLQALFADRLTAIILIAVLCFGIQMMTKNKFLGFTIVVALFFITSMFNRFGISNDLVKYASGGLGTFSDMNGFGNFLQYLVLLRIYWIGPALALLVVAIIFYPRGNVQGFGERWKAGRDRVSRKNLFLIATLLVLTVLVGAYVGKNSRQVAYIPDEHNISYPESRASLSPDNSPLPLIEKVTLRMELFPSKREFSMDGSYQLVNRSLMGITQFFVQLPKLTDEVKVTFECEASQRIETIPGMGASRVELNQPFQSGDTILLKFYIEYHPRKVDKPATSNHDVVLNGSVLDYNYLPVLSSEIKKRTSHNTGFPFTSEMEELPPRYTLNEGAGMKWDIEVGTSQDQVVVAPGTLMETHQAGHRKYFHFFLEKSSSPFISIYSAQYHQAQDRLGNIELKTNLHPGHTANINAMFDAIKDALSYNEKALGPYIMDQLSVVEFPNYETERPSAPGILPFSENSPVTREGDRPNTLGMPYFLTAAGTSSQWWQHQTPTSDPTQKREIVEGLANYFALMTVRKRFGEEAVGKHLKWQMDQYLRGRSLERGRERPLVKARQGQHYIYNNKGGIVFYGLQDYLGEEALNNILKSYYQTCRADDNEPVLTDLVEDIRARTPDSLQYVIHDLFTSITLFDNRMVTADYRLLPNDIYDITISTLTNKIVVDSLGNEERIGINDWIQVGVYTLNAEGTETLTYLNRFHFDSGETRLNIRMPTQPTRVVIDPYHKLIDKKLEDNELIPRRYLDASDVILN